MPKLLGLKLIHRMAAAPAYVTVWVDGTPSVPETTPDRVWTNGFSQGSSSGSLRGDREWIDLGTLRNSYENGKELTFRFIGRRTWCNDPQCSTWFRPNDVVELWAQTPQQRSDVATPPWHLNGAPAGSVQRLFYGHVRRVQSTGSGLEITCSDPRWAANRIILRTALGECDIPRIAFNLPKDAPDYVYNSLKLKNAATSPPVGTGVPADPNNDRLTVNQVLRYLADKYRSLLVLNGVQDAALDLIFDPADLAGLSYKMGQVALSDCGFTDGVRQILDAWAPHLRLVVDHRTTAWRLVEYGAALKESSTTGTVLAMDGPSGMPACAASDPSFFVPGKRYRFYGGGTIAAPLYQLSQELVCHHVTGGTVFFTGTLLWAFVSWKAAALDEFAMPNLVLNLDDTPRGGVTLALDVDEVFTAVQLWSIYRVTATQEQSWNRQNLSSGGMQPGWDQTFEQYWSSRDSDREMDVGGGEGMIPWRVGNDGTNDYLEISYGESQYATRHAPGEWKDTSLWVWTAAGANVRNLKLSFTVLASIEVANVGDGSRGLRLTLASGVGGFLAKAPGFVFGAAGGTPDRVALTQNYGLLKTTKGNNKRWEVGRKFWFTDTTVTFDADASPHVSSCVPMRLWENDGTETPRRAMGMHPGLGYPALNTTPAGAFEQLAGGGIGATMVWRRAQYTRKPTGTPCGRGVGWKPPSLVQAEVETTTTTLRAVRYPLEGYAGTAWLESSYAAQKDIAVEDWAEDGQTLDFAQLAFRLWQTHSSTHQVGTIIKPGARANAIWLDLGVRCSLVSSITSARFAAAAGAGAPGGSTIEGFWGPLTECALEFASDTVSFGFDNGHPMEDITSELYEKTGITLTSLAQKNAEYARALAQLNECIRGSQTNETPTSMCADRVFGNDGQSITKKLTTSTKPQQEAGAKATGAAW